MHLETKTEMAEESSYPQLFRQMIVRSVRAALAGIDSTAPSLDDDVCERSIYTLRLALKLPSAWPEASELMLTVSPYLRWQGDSAGWMTFLEEGIAAADSLGDVGALAKLHRQFGWFCRVFSRLEQAEEHARRAYALARQQNDTATRIDALYELMATAGQRSDFAPIQSYANELFELTDAEDPRRALPYALLGYVAERQGEYESSIRWKSEALHLHTAAGQYRFAAQVEQQLGWTNLYCGRYKQALVYFQRAMETLALHAGPLDVADVRTDLAWCYYLLEDYERASEMCRLSEPVFVNLGDKKRLSVCYNHYGMIYARMGHFEKAEMLLLQSISLVRGLNLAFEVANVLESLGRMYREKGDLELALVTWEQALEELKTLSEPPRRLHNMLLERIQEVKSIQENLAPGSPEFEAH